MRKSGFTLVEIMIVVAIIGLLAAIAIPSFVRARDTSQTNACINNLRQIDGAQQMILTEEGAGHTITDAEVNERLHQDDPECPASGTAYALTTTPPVCPSVTEFPDHVLP